MHIWVYKEIHNIYSKLNKVPPFGNAALDLEVPFTCTWPAQNTDGSRSHPRSRSLARCCWALRERMRKSRRTANANTWPRKHPTRHMPLIKLIQAQTADVGWWHCLIMRAANWIFSGVKTQKHDTGNECKLTQVRTEKQITNSRELKTVSAFKPTLRIISIHLHSSPHVVVSSGASCVWAVETLVHGATTPWQRGATTPWHWIYTLP